MTPSKYFSQNWVNVEELASKKKRACRCEAPSPASVSCLSPVCCLSLCICLGVCHPTDQCRSAGVGPVLGVVKARSQGVPSLSEGFGESW